jgi:pimeloyl-ACP methyl ester carboxylesterase
LINKLRVLLFYDPVPALKKISCPVLSIHGEKDLQAPSKENREAIEKALLDSGHQDHTIIELEGLNHLLQTAKTGSLTEYAKIAETIAPKALEVIAGWIQARFVEH